MLNYTMFYCTTTRAELCEQLGIAPKDLKWLVNAPNHILDEKTLLIWEYALSLISKRIGELFAVRRVIDHKVSFVRKARIENKMLRKV